MQTTLLIYSLKYLLLPFRRIWQIWYLFAFYGIYLLIFPIYVYLFQNPTRKKLQIYHFLGRGWCWGLILCGLTYCRIKRNFHLKPDDVFLFASNHRSILDVPLGMITIPYIVKYLGKSEIAKVPLFNYTYKRVHILVDRGKKEDRAKSLHAIKEQLENGYSVLIYPEGTSKTPYDHKLGDLKDGVFIIALQTRIPIVPITIINSNKGISNDGKFWVNPFVIFTTIVDPPIPMDDLTVDDVEELKIRFRKVINARLAEYYPNPEHNLNS